MEGRRAFAPPIHPGVYLWLTGDPPRLALSYVGQTKHLQQRFYEHSVSTLGGGYLLYEPKSLASGLRQEPRYVPRYATYFRDFLDHWEELGHVAYQNLTSYHFTWAQVDGDKRLRESIESALICEARRLEAPLQNPRTSRDSSVATAIRIEHRLPPGVTLHGLVSPTEFGEEGAAAV
jgi:hypothetical protein